MKNEENKERDVNYDGHWLVALTIKMFESKLVIASGNHALDSIKKLRQTSTSYELLVWFSHMWNQWCLRADREEIYKYITYKIHSGCEKWNLKHVQKYKYQ